MLRNATSSAVHVWQLCGLMCAVAGLLSILCLPNAACACACACVQAALPYLGNSHPPALHQAAAKALMAIGRLDPDGVWLLLFDAAANMPPAAAAAVGGAPAAARQAGLGGRCPPLQALLPALPAAAGGRYSSSGAAGHRASSSGASPQWGVTAQLAADCGARAQALLALLEAQPRAPWHNAKVLSRAVQAG
jgi:hypothetical protein